MRGVRGKSARLVSCGGARGRRGGWGVASARHAAGPPPCKQAPAHEACAHAPISPPCPPRPSPASDANLALAPDDTAAPEAVPDVFYLSTGEPALLESGELLGYGGAAAPAGAYSSYGPAALAGGYAPLGGYGGYLGLYGGGSPAAGAVGAGAGPRRATTATMISEADAEAQAAAAAAAAGRPAGRSLLAAAGGAAAGARGGPGGRADGSHHDHHHHHHGGHPLLMAHRGGRGPAGPPPGECYCRHDSASGAWGLQEPSCRAALLSKCGPAGALLECAAIQPLYTLAPGGANDVAAQRTATAAAGAFLFADCPPAPPCSCATLRLDAGDAPGPKARCCSDLRTHCAAPFLGLSCGDVGAYCGAARAAPAAVRQFVGIKTHRQDCSSPLFARAYTRFVHAPPPAAPGVGAALRSLGRGGLVAAAATACALGSLAAAAALAVAVARRLVAQRGDDTIPLLASY
jgi:hypothetical protein